MFGLNHGVKEKPSLNHQNQRSMNRQGKAFCNSGLCTVHEPIWDT